MPIPETYVPPTIPSDMGAARRMPGGDPPDSGLGHDADEDTPPRRHSPPPEADIHHEPLTVGLTQVNKSGANADVDRKRSKLNGQVNGDSGVGPLPVEGGDTRFHEEL